MRALICDRAIRMGFKPWRSNAAVLAAIKETRSEIEGVAEQDWMPRSSDATRTSNSHVAIVASREPEQPEKIPAFRWVNTITGNLKTTIAGTLKSVAKRYVQRYFDEFQWRFNRRVDLPSLLPRLARAAATAAPRPYRTLKVAHEAG